MKLSLNWLKTYLPIEHTPERVGEILTDIGLEVEGLEQVESIKGGLEGLVIGEVLSCEKHPNADKLKVTTVNVGADEPLHIVCGAPNVAAGQKVVVATIGTTLYPIEGDAFKIKKGKIRGEVSEGMICAEDEIGLGNDHDGIIVLDGSATVGTAAKDHYEVSIDNVFEIGLTPNRSDATCHLGAAADLAAYLKINETQVDVDHPDTTSFYIESNTLPFKVTVENEEACPRYTGVTISGITVKSSPQWLKDKLNAVGVRPINNIVDITNYILHEYGQPLHAFDADKLEGSEIIVGTLADQSKFTTLDEKERKLSDEDLMICDGAKNGLCIAGVFGGIGSGISESTKNIFLESAHFNAGWIRRTSTRHLLRTDAAKVFEKGSDPNITLVALKRAALMIQELAGGRVSSEVIDVYPNKIEPKSIHINYSNVQRMMGVSITKDEIHGILNAMNMELEPVNEDSVIVKVPTNKSDVLREADVIEEILRIYGFNKVPIPTKIKASVTHSQNPSRNGIKSLLANYLASNGFNEMMGLSLIEERQVFPELGTDSSQLVFINNTSNIHLNIMRPEPMVSGLLSVLHNINYQQRSLKMFEFGKSYVKHGDEFSEPSFLSLFVVGAKATENWIQGPEQATDIYELKQWVQWVLSRLGINSFQVSELDHSKFNYGMKYHRGDKEIVSFGEVSSEVLEKLDLKSDVYYAEFHFDNLYDFASKQKLSTKEISKFPAVRRDLALVLDENVTFDQIIGISKKIKSKILQGVSLFDVYRSKEHLGEGKKSYAIKMIFQDNKGTLKDKIVDKEVNKMMALFESELSAQIRK